MSLLSLTSVAEDRLITPANTILDLSYGSNPSQQMDVYLPEDRSKYETRSLILVHGGGWNSGSRHTLNAYIDSFKQRMPGYAIFNIDYRLVRSALDFPAQQNDIKAAVDFIASHADTYQIHSGKLILLGVSAGGHLALLQSYKYTSPKIAAVIDFFGPTDLLGMYNKPWNPVIPHLVEKLLNGSPATNGAAYRNASPVNFINAETPPTIIFHGKQDYMVDISQSQLLHQKLEQAHVPNEMIVYHNAGHGWYGETLSNSFDKIELFLKKYVP